MLKNVENKIAAWYVSGGKLTLLKILLVVMYILKWASVITSVVFGIVYISFGAQWNIPLAVFFGVLILLFAPPVAFFVFFLLIGLTKGEINFQYRFIKTANKLEIYDCLYPVQDETFKVLVKGYKKSMRRQIPFFQKYKIKYDDKLLKPFAAIGDDVVLKKDKEISHIDKTRVSNGTLGKVVSKSGSTLFVEVNVNGRNRIVSINNDDAEVING